MWSGWNAVLESSQHSQTPCECVPQSQRVYKGGEVWTFGFSLCELSCGPSLYTVNGLIGGQASRASLSSWGQIVSCKGQILTSETILMSNTILIQYWYNTWTINHTILKVLCLCLFVFLFFWFWFNLCFCYSPLCLIAQSSEQARTFFMLLKLREMWAKITLLCIQSVTKWMSPT